MNLFSWDPFYVRQTLLSFWILISWFGTFLIWIRMGDCFFDWIQLFRNWTIYPWNFNSVRFTMTIIFLLRSANICFGQPWHIHEKVSDLSWLVFWNIEGSSMLLPAPLFCLFPLFQSNAWWIFHRISVFLQSGY